MYRNLAAAALTACTGLVFLLSRSGFDAAGVRPWLSLMAAASLAVVFVAVPVMVKAAVESR